MLYTIITIFIILVFFDKALRLEQKKLLNLETQYRLFALRDELRREETTEDSEFLDKLITAMAQNLSEFSVLQMCAYHFVNGVSDQSNQSKRRLNNELKLIESDKNLSTIYKKFTDELFTYLSKRYSLLINIAKASLVGGVILIILFVLIRKFNISLPDEKHSVVSR